MDFLDYFVYENERDLTTAIMNKEMRDLGDKLLAISLEKCFQFMFTYPNYNVHVCVDHTHFKSTPNNKSFAIFSANLTCQVNIFVQVIMACF